MIGAVGRPKDSQDIPSLEVFQVKKGAGKTKAHPVKRVHKARKWRGGLQASA